MKCSSLNIRYIHKQEGTKLGSQKLHISPKVTKMESIIDHRIDYNGIVALRSQRHISNKIQNFDLEAES